MRLGSKEEIILAHLQHRADASVKEVMYLRQSRRLETPSQRGVQGGDLLALSSSSPPGRRANLGVRQVCTGEKAIATQKDNLPYSHSLDQGHTPGTVKLFEPSGRAGGPPASQLQLSPDSNNM